MLTLAFLFYHICFDMPLMSLQHIILHEQQLHFVTLTLVEYLDIMPID